MILLKGLNLDEILEINECSNNEIFPNALYLENCILIEVGKGYNGAIDFQEITDAEFIRSFDVNHYYSHVNRSLNYIVIC